jgi:DegV family protein with EDD domain
MVKDTIGVTVIDSEVISHLLWAVILRLDAARKAGQPLENLVAIADECKRRAKLFFMVDTMKYLEMGGRVGKAQAFLGQLLNVKPILTLTDGGVPTPKAKAKGTKAAMRELVALTKAAVDQLPEGQEVTLITAHADNAEGLAYLESLIDAAGIKVTNRISGWVGAVVGSYVGPGTIAIGVV